MFKRLLKSKFQIKCKSSIESINKRVEMIKNRRSAMQKHLKNDIAFHLQKGHNSEAYADAGTFLEEMKLLSCYEYVELSCLCISTHLSAMCKNRECPDNCREAVSNLMFAAARFADLPELRKLRNLFTERYGKSVECYANTEFVAKLMSTTHLKDKKLQLLQDIAHESGIEWNLKALEQMLYKPPAVEQGFKGDERINNNSDGKKKGDATQNGLDLSDEEERKMDKLMMHYSNKNATPEPSKEETKSRRKEYNLQSRAASLPVEPTSPVETKRGHTRATSYQTDIYANGYVHPKLPDYDDLVAQFAAPRGEKK